MFKEIFSAVTPLACMLSVVFAPVGVSANQYNYGSQDCCQTSCEQDPCCNNNGRSWLRDAAIFVGAAAVGAIAGVAAGESSGKRGRHGDIGLTGPTGLTGATGPAGAGFVVATVPPGQPGAGAPVTSLTFTFTTLVAVSVIGPFQAYVTTPDGVTTMGTVFTGVLGSTATVTITGTLYQGQYNVGIIAPAAAITLAGVVTAEVTSINGTPASPALDDVGIVVAASVLSDETFFNAQYPFENVPVGTFP